MTAASENLIRDLAQKGIRLAANGDRLHVEAKPGTVTPEVRRLLTERKADLLAALKGDPIADLRASLLNLADTMAIDPALVRALPESEISATGEQVAACDPGDRRNVMAAYLRALAETDLRRRGKVPADETAVALCRHCGPVWIAPKVADAAP